jgi:hypothetical protein
MLHLDEHDDDSYIQGLSLLNSDNTPSGKSLGIFLNPDDKHQRQLFKRLKLSEPEKVVQAYVSTALGLITSITEDPFKKSQALTSLVNFVDYGNEGLLEYINFAYNESDQVYLRILNTLSSYFRQGQAPVDELRQILIAITNMNYFRVKKTMMLGYVSYELPEYKNSKWYLDRLTLVQCALKYPDNEIAHYAFSFLWNCFRTREKIFDNPGWPSNERTKLLNVLELIDREVPKWLLSSDWRVSMFAIVYCGIRKLTDTKEILEQLALSENEKIRESAKGILSSPRFNEH